MPKSFVLKVIFTLLILAAIFVLSSFITALTSEIEVASNLRTNTDVPRPTLEAVNPEDLVEDKKGEEKIISIPAPVIKHGESFPVPDTDVRDTARRATVNILCTAKKGRRLITVTGSGVFVDPRGVILTNAHVADYLLFQHDEDPFDDVKCSVRQGSPAVPLYNAEILYLPPKWVADNLDEFAKDSPSGIGEHDYAFLIADLPPNVAISFVRPDEDDSSLDIGMPVLVAGYPAGFFKKTSELVETLFVFSTIANITDLFTFTSETLDLISIEGSIIAQSGSSGGAVVGADKKLKAIIGLTSKGESPSDRYIRAITVSHINRSLLEFMGVSISGLLSGDLDAKADQYNTNIAPALREALGSVI